MVSKDLQIYTIAKGRISYFCWGRVPKQTCSQSALRGVSTHDMEQCSVNSRVGKLPIFPGNFGGKAPHVSQNRCLGCVGYKFTFLGELSL